MLPPFDLAIIDGIESIAGGEARGFGAFATYSPASS